MVQLNLDRPVMPHGYDGAHETPDKRNSLPDLTKPPEIDSAPVKAGITPVLRNAKEPTLTRTQRSDIDTAVVGAAGRDDAALHRINIAEAAFNDLSRDVEDAGPPIQPKAFFRKNWVTSSPRQATT